MARRNLRPRPTTPVAPLVVSTRTLAKWTEIPERRFREALAEHPEVKCSPLGRDVLLSSDAVATLLDVLRNEAGAASVDGSEDDDSDTPTTTDGVLARLGLKRTA
jgi:hypothetical protein